MPDIANVTVHNTNKSGQAKIRPPLPPTRLSFTNPQLYGCLGRAMALSGAKPSVVRGLTRAFGDLLKTLIDSSKKDLTFLADVETLSDNLRTALSGFVGAGIADLYMVNLGYAYRANGRELVHTGQVFDLAYDGGPLSGTDIVAVEAKGSLRTGATPANISRTTRDGYLSQVEPYVGTKVGKHTAAVVHGYAIGTGSQLKQGVPCHMHVEQTGWMAASTGGPPPPRRGGSVTWRKPNAPVAIRNYRAVFCVMGDNGGILDAIDRALSGAWNAIGGIPAQQLNIVTWRGGEYVATPSFPPHVPFVSNDTFGLRLDVASSFFNGLTTCIRDGLIPGMFPQELPVRALDESLGSLPSDGGAEFPDGLAYFGPEPPVSTTSTLRWHPQTGLTS